ncbi:MAG: hypothetical protein OZ948_16195 [Deltaproteobacteria bacterium]|nr:hypothetical protein [Deltaproteobacteria bacterium]
MRIGLLPVALLLGLAVLPGCFLDEIDKSMERYQGSRKTAEASKPAGSKPAAAGAPAAKPAGPSWWETARTLGSDPKNEAIAGCQLAGRVEFMLRDDCLARGGQPQ